MSNQDKIYFSKQEYNKLMQIINDNLKCKDDDIRYRVVSNSSFEVLRDEEKEMLLKKGWTAEKFNSISQEERNQAVKCIAF